MEDPQRLKILYLSAECVPFAKTGGLADVAGSLPKAVRGLGHDIRIMMPRYGRVEVDKFGLKPLIDHLDVPMDERTEPASVLESQHRLCFSPDAGALCQQRALLRPAGHLHVP